MNSEETVFNIPSWLCERRLPNEVSLEVLEQGVVVFSSTGKWLYPLFDVERYLIESTKEASGLVLHDRICGQAAAALAVRMGFRLVKASVMSRLAINVYRRYGVQWCADHIVDRIACMTESLIDESMDLQSIYLLVRTKANI